MNSTERHEARYRRRRAARDEARREAMAACGGFETVFSPMALSEASRKSQRGVSWKRQVQGFALDRLELHLREHFKYHGTRGGMLVFDFSKYFANIDVATAMEQIAHVVPDERLLAVTRLFMEGGGDEHIGDDGDRRMRGLGLGNQTSQTAAILYPNAIDHWAKEVWRVRGYGRYMDDGYAIFADWDDMRRFAVEFRDRCAAIGIVINEHKFRFIHMTEPFVFLKMRFQLDLTGHVRRRVCPENLKRERRRLRKMVQLVREGLMTEDDLRLSYASWRGSILRRDASCLLTRQMDGYLSRTLRG